MTEFEIVTPPEDYNHPISEQDEPCFKRGDSVRLQDGSIGVVDDVADFYMNRASQKVYRRNYMIELDAPKSGMAWAFGYQLTPLDTELHNLREAYQNQINEMERQHNRERLDLHQKFINDVADYERRKAEQKAEKP